jgi:signal transduction histidine kinase
MFYRVALFPTPRVEFACGSVEAITGHPPEAFYAMPGLTRASLHPDDHELFHRMVSDPAGSPAAVVLRWIHPDGHVVSAEHRRVPVYDSLGRLIAVEGIARDITSVLESQQRLRDSETQMRQLAARVQTAREEERARVARELHDEVGQTLTALKLEIGRVQAELSADRMTPTLVDRMQSLIGLSDIGLAIVKRIATNLRPPTLDHLGLAEAIHWEALTFKARTGIRCHLRANKRRSALAAEQRTALFRIFQEALTNIVRHAQASAVNVSLTERVQQVELRISDNGRGISDEQAANPRALGLIGMRERAALVGGEFRIVGRGGKGTVVTVLLPVDAPKPRPRARRPASVK